MNRYTLAADGHRWWWGSAVAGTAAAAAVGAILALPTAGHAMPVPTTRHEPAPAYVLMNDASGSAGATDQNCFIYRADWNVGLDGPRPVCHWDVRVDDTDSDTSDVLRVGLDWRP
jgi:hypothetical protein